MKWFRETELPGIGKKFQAETRSGDRLVLVVHDDGRRECYHFDDRNPDEAVSLVTLDDDEARLVAAILGGVTYKPKTVESVEMALDDLIIEWYRIEADYRCAGRTIGELDIRRRSGATVIAIVDKDRVKHVNPGPDIMLTTNSTVVAVGERGQQKQFKAILLNGCDAHE